MANPPDDARGYLDIVKQTIGAQLQGNQATKRSANSGSERHNTLYIAVCIHRRAANPPPNIISHEVAADVLARILVTLQKRTAECRPTAQLIVIIGILRRRYGG